MKHEQIYTILKTAMVDKEIVPVVSWLNSFKEVYTEYSCQGGLDEEFNGIVKPYVLFRCDDMNVLYKIAKRLDGYAIVNVFPSDVVQYPRFRIEFEDENFLNDFNESLEVW